MTWTIDTYLDRARMRSHAPSDRQLAFQMKIEPSTLNGWRMKRCWPADDQMVTLANLAGANPKIALLSLNAWRTKSDRAREAYTTMATLIAKSLALGAMALILLGSPPGTKAAQNDAESSASAYYGKFRRRLRRLMATLLPQFRQGLSIRT